MVEKSVRCKPKCLEKLLSVTVLPGTLRETGREKMVAKTKASNYPEPTRTTK